MVLGWDIGGVHTKVARVESGVIASVLEEPFELQREPAALVSLLQRLARDAGASGDARHAVTMTAELSQMFRTKRDGVAFVVDAVQTAFPGTTIRVFTVEGRFISTNDARQHPLSVAAANWMATAAILAQRYADALLIDVGSTTTDIIPIAGGRVVACGRTDVERLGSGELVYTGAVRTPVEAVVQHVTIGGTRVGVSAEGFALTGDVHVWRGDLREEDYSAPTPDGRSRDRDACGDRLLRVVCADREMLGDREIGAMADEIAAAQVRQIADAVSRVAANQAAVPAAVVTGRGAFLGAAAARLAGLEVHALEQDLGAGAARSAPAAAVALLYDQAPDVADSVLQPFSSAAHRTGTGGAVVIDAVVKMGGSALHHPAALDRALSELDAVSGAIIVVPGGGPFADAVRDVDRTLTLSDEVAHWMAVRAMDQYAELLASRMRRGVLAFDLEDIQQAVRDGRIPVLAPHGWLRRSDPVPHSWDVTSDSIAAWVARVTGARQLVLIKPGAPRKGPLTDAFFERALPENVRVAVAFLDEPGAVRAALEAVVAR
jgi:probable H4MPT-linked C1 transfer pathway protein